MTQPIHTEHKPPRPPVTIIRDHDGKGGMVGAFSVDDIRRFFGDRVKITIPKGKSDGITPRG